MAVFCEKVTKKAHRYKDDAYVVRNDFLYAVINGAPFLYSKNKDLNHTYEFINDLKKALNAFDGRSRIANFLYDFSIKEYKKFPDLWDKDASFFPGCGLALLVIQDDMVEFYTLGDCNIVYKTKDYNKFIIESKEIHDADNLAIKEAKDYALDHRISIKKALNYIQDTLIKNRKNLNSLEQTGLFTALENPHFKFTHRRVYYEDLEFVYLFSDGFASAYKSLELYESYQDMFTPELDLKEVQTKITNKWNEDKKLNKYPRLYYKDDITVLKLIFENKATRY